MPLKTTSVNTDQVKYVDAAALLKMLADKGVPTANLCEEIMEGGSFVYVPTTDSNWGDDGAPSIFYASIWGKFQDVATVIKIFKSGLPWLAKYVNLATISFYTDSPSLTASLALQAVDALPGVTTDLNRILAIDIPLDPTMPAVVGSVPRIN